MAMGSGDAAAKRRAGVLCFREASESDADFELLVVSRRSRVNSDDDTEQSHDKYTIPAGKFEAEVDRSCQDCALREALEEAGVECRVVEDLGWFASSSKHGEPIQTRYFLARCVTALEHWLEESSRSRVWLPPEEALKRVNYRQDLAAVVAQGTRALQAARAEGPSASSSKEAPEEGGREEDQVPCRSQVPGSDERYLCYTHQVGGHFKMVKPAPGTRLEVEMPFRRLGEQPNGAGSEQAFTRSRGDSGDTCTVSGCKVVLKPFDAREEQFYCQTMMDDLLSIRSFVPLFYGTKKLNREQVEDLAFNDAQEATLVGRRPDVDPADTESKYASQHVRRYLVLEDLGGSSSLPCFLDLKVGCRQRSARHNAQKRAHMATKAAQTTSAELGFRICGMQCFDRKTNTVQQYDKYWGQKVTRQSMSRTLAMFFGLGLEDRGSGPRVGISEMLVETVLEKLRRLESLLQQLPGKRFWGSSLLIFFDACLAEEETRESCRKSVQLKIIDFANFQDVGGSLPDEEYLCGINNACMFLEALLQPCALDGHPADGLLLPPPAEVQDQEQERARQRLKQLQMGSTCEAASGAGGDGDESNLLSNAQTISGATGRTLRREVAPRHLMRLEGGDCRSSDGPQTYQSSLDRLFE